MTDPILLPSRPGPKAEKPRLIDFGGQLKPALGGPVQTILRLGTRHGIDITLPNMWAEPTGRVWSSRLRQAKIYGALWHWRQDGLAIGLPGAPVVDGGGQAGSAIALRGFRPGYAVREGQAFSLVSAGRRYLHFAGAPGVADGAGRLALGIFPMLRVIPADGDLCEFAQPIMQGSLSGNEASWDAPMGGYYNFGTITISEDA